MGILSRFWVWAGHVSLAQWLLSLAGGTVTGAMAFVANQPLWLVIFVSLGATAFILVITTRASLYGKVRPGEWRDLFAILARVDARIPGLLEAGHTHIQTRISEADYVDLVRFKQTPNGMRLIRDVEINGQLRDSQMANGSLGPSEALPLQYRVEIWLNEPAKDVRPL